MIRLAAAFLLQFISPAHPQGSAMPIEWDLNAVPLTASDPAAAYLAAGPAISGRPLEDVIGIFRGISSGTRPDSKDAAKLASGAAIAGLSHTEILSLYHGVRQHYQYDVSSSQASLAVGAAVSHRMTEDLLEDAKFVEAKLDSREPAEAELIAGGAALARVSVREVLFLYKLVIQSPGRRQHGAAGATLAYAALLLRDKTAASDLQRRFNHPIQRPRLGDNQSAEELFKLHWHSAIPQ